MNKYKVSVSDRVSYVEADRYDHIGDNTVFWVKENNSAVDTKVASFRFIESVEIVKPAFEPMYHAAEVTFTVNGHEGDVRRLLGEWAASHAYTLEGLEVTQTQCPYRRCSCSCR